MAYTSNDFKLQRPSLQRHADFQYLKSLPDRSGGTTAEMKKIYAETCEFLHWVNRNRLVATSDELTHANLIITLAKEEEYVV